MTDIVTRATTLKEKLYVFKIAIYSWLIDRIPKEMLGMLLVRVAFKYATEEEKKESMDFIYLPLNTFIGRVYRKQEDTQVE
jgi:hypothetical protein